MSCRCLAGLLLLLTGCLAPSIVMVDRKTSLEQQAAGTYPMLARELEESGVAAGPVPLTRLQLQQGTPAADATAESTEASDALRVEAMLQRKCLGEALDGRIAETRTTCAGDPDEQEMAHLVERTNHSRQQTWAYLAQLRPAAKPETVRAAWRATHLREVSCGAQIQLADSSWEPKKC